MFHSLTHRPSHFTIGLPPDTYSQRSWKTYRRPVTTQSTLLRYLQNRQGYSSTPITQFWKQSPSNSTRRLLPLSVNWHCQCQHHRHRQHPQPIFPCQIQWLTPQRRWFQSYTSPSNRPLQRWRNFAQAHLCHWHLNHSRCTNTNYSAPLFQNGTGRHQQPPYSLHR